MQTVKELQPIQNVEHVQGRYTRENFTHDMFKPVTTTYSLTTRNLENYLSNKIKNAKDITKVFKNLEKQGYTITTVETQAMGTPFYNTEIGGIFNGNIRTINIIWRESTPEYAGKENFKQEIFCIIK